MVELERYGQSMSIFSISAASRAVPLIMLQLRPLRAIAGTVLLGMFVLLAHTAKAADTIAGAAAYSFQKEGLHLATTLYGPPSVKVREVFIKYTTGTPYTTINNEIDGVFTIYMTRKPHEYAFWGQLAHEIAHLLNVRLYDVYVEGLNGVFAEKLLKRQGKDWSGWERHYRQGGDSFYASTYYMMRDVENIAGQNSIRSLLSFARPVSQGSHRMYIDINGWLKTMPVAQKEKIVDIILHHAPSIRIAMENVEQKSAFLLPR